MSVYRTIRISRSRAITELLKHIATKATDTQLADMLDELLRASLYNCVVIEDSQENDDADLNYALDHDQG